MMNDTIILFLCYMTLTSRLDAVHFTAYCKIYIRSNVILNALVKVHSSYWLGTRQSEQP